MIRGAVLRGSVPERAGYTASEWLLIRDASQAVAEWRLVRDHAADYLTLGYDSGNGQPARFKLLEYITITGLHQEAEHDAWQQSATSTG